MPDSSYHRGYLLHWRRAWLEEQHHTVVAVRTDQCVDGLSGLQQVRGVFPRVREPRYRSLLHHVQQGGYHHGYKDAGLFQSV